MKVLVVFDSVYGNTEQIARAIAGALPSGAAKAVRVSEANLSELAAIDLLIIGSPTQGGRPTQAMLEFLAKLSASALTNVKVAAFDTRLSTKWVGIFGYAAGKIAESLQAKGGTLVAPPQPFYVKGKEGPLQDGELVRAAGWAERILGEFEKK